MPPPPPSLEPEPVNWALARSHARASGLALAVVMFIPILSLLFPVWGLLCGAWTVRSYKRNRPESTISAGNGLRMGLSTGVFAFAVQIALAALWASIEYAVRHQLAFVAQFQQRLQAAIQNNPDPQVRQMAAGMLTPTGMAGIFVFVAIVVLVLLLLFCGAGGALGASMFGKRKP